MEQKKQILIISLFLLPFFVANIVLGQTEKDDYKITANRFEEYYNAGQFELIFSSLFSNEMQKALPVEKTRQFLADLKSQAGKITKRDFIEYEKTYASYKTRFEKGLFVINISLDEHSKINGLFVKPFREKRLPEIERNITKLILPFNEEWFVFWGGDTKELNYHVENIAQKNAFDFVITDDQGKSYKNNGETNEDYYAFGKELFAPCDGEVVLVVDGVKDNKPGQLNPVYVPGNTVIIKTENNEYLFFAHFKQHSIQVRQGQKVKQGDLLGYCGNSGNSSEAHLHFHIQNVENMYEATGIKCYFDKVIVHGKQKKDYSPIKNDKVKN
ncbi:MAG: peptidoglycan DD-metalloendopeptidase family protein [Planctomycetaceae bacterium]|jgi:murein DD-endopeptidase MepM/ murein hydrolase activator NlpD|nr:peptidoglycan DD-metalloendopeptidase family protein [Planctomycetaceae bacterium]